MKTYIKQEIYLEIESKDIDRKIVLDSYREVLSSEFQKVLDQFVELVRFDSKELQELSNSCQGPVNLRLLTKDSYRRLIISK